MVFSYEDDGEERIEDEEDFFPGFEEEVVVGEATTKEDHDRGMDGEADDDYEEGGDEDGGEFAGAGGRGGFRDGFCSHFCGHGGIIL